MLSSNNAGKWQLLQLLDRSLNTQKEFGATDKDTDDVIRLMAGECLPLKLFAVTILPTRESHIAETPLWLLGVTFFVSIVHMLFDILAFKSDISFWSGTKR